MKSFLYIALLYLVLSVLVISCTESEPEPACVSAEVVGADCESNWYILKLTDKEANANGSNGYTGQLQGGFVTTDNLPEELQQPGTKLQVALELYTENSPRCVTVAVMYPAVKVKRVCSSSVPS